MRTKEKLKQAICEAVDRLRGEIEKIGDQIMENPELGFKEFKTAKLVADTMKSFGIPHETGLAITGVKGVIRGKNPGPTVALMGELDSLLVSDHPHADSETGAAHAGSSPHKGINALNAAHIALAAIHAQRETFKDGDAIRVHPIITRGGDLVNVVPADVRLETFVRGKTNQAIMDANIKVDRALRAGAMAIGARVEINTLPGYMPFQDNRDMQKLFMQNAQMLFGAEECTEAGHRTGSTDMGDISHLMPSVHPSMSGASGISHGNDFLISDKEMAYLAPAKALALMAVDLLCCNAEKAKEIQAQHKPIMSKEEYLTYQNRIFQKEIFDGKTGTSKKLNV